MQDKFEERVKKMARILESLDAERNPEESKILQAANKRYHVGFAKAVMALPLTKVLLYYRKAEY